MTGLELSIAFFLLLNLAAALERAARGPTPADRMLAALLFGSTGVGILVLLAIASDARALIDVALTLALLAAITGIAFVQLAWGKVGSNDNKAGDARGDDNAAR
jgi:multicomponent Na+:H+ antiporter subunit F